MTKSIKTLFRLLQNFGVEYGISLFINFKLNRLDNLRLPNINSSISLRKGTSDSDAFYQVFVLNEYKIDFIERPKVIIDGGANIGLFTVLMKNKFPEAKVISVEPDKDNFAMLQKNVANYNNVYCENLGLWNRKTKLKIYDKFEMGKWAMVVEESEAEGNIEAISIDELVCKYAINTIDILKLDIETSEKILFLDNYEGWLPKVKMIIIELHDCLEEDCSKPFFVAINKTFSKYTYSISGENTVIINNDLV
ncbi:FkbM family methyltransferase [Adhaeribacter aerolatus]|nr:FkbM family methyltransferase [Adhaeribacter aerolatus]